MSILEKLINKNERIAFQMSSDLLLAGIDTVNDKSF